MAFKEMAQRQAQNESSVIGQYSGLAVKGAITAAGALAGGLGALGGSGGLEGAVMGGLRISGIASPGAQLAMSSINQAIEAKKSSDHIDKMLTGKFDEDFHKADKSLRMLNKMPSEFIMEGLLESDKDGNVDPDSYKHATQVISLLDQHKKSLQRQMVTSYMMREVAQDLEEDK